MNRSNAGGQAPGAERVFRNLVTIGTAVTDASSVRPSTGLGTAVDDAGLPLGRIGR
jgi:hypothetical protein